MRGESADFLSRVQLWSPDVRPTRGEFRPRSGLRMACILSDRLFDGLAEEVELLLLTEATWEETLRFGRADLLLIESTWFSCTGDWYMTLSTEGERREQLESLLRLTRSLGIPSVFWMTHDGQHLDLYRAFLRQFDHVFCADPKAVDALRLEGFDAALLEPAVQPRRFNPIRWADDATEFTSGVVYDGWKDLYRFADVRALLAQLPPEALSVIDTTCMMKRVQVERIPEPGVRSAVKGWVHRHLLPEIYKRGDAYLTFSQTASTPTQAIWRLLEAVACRLPALHFGHLEPTDPRGRFARVYGDPEEYVAAVIEMVEDPVSREKAAHAAWRDVHTNHCFAARLATICSSLGLRYEWRPFPKASLVTGTMRPHLLEKCVQQFLDQTYPNKELIIVFNGNRSEIDAVRQKYSSREDISFLSVPTDYNAASILNIGAMKATGEYFFRVDDDDHYGANYIGDCMLYLRACDSAVFGKPASFYHFEGEDGIYLRRDVVPEILRFPAAELHESQRTLISGCSFSCRLELLKSVLYPDNINLSADTELVERLRSRHGDLDCLILDSLNLVVERSADVERHTWQQSAEVLKRGSRAVGSSISDVML